MDKQQKKKATWIKKLSIFIECELCLLDLGVLKLWIFFCLSIIIFFVVQYNPLFQKKQPPYLNLKCQNGASYVGLL